MIDKAEDCLTILRFADDVLLFSTSLEKLREMLCEFKTSTDAVGLGIHPDKTKILSNQDRTKTKESPTKTIAQCTGTRRSAERCQSPKRV